MFDILPVFPICISFAQTAVIIFMIYHYGLLWFHLGKIMLEKETINAKIFEFNLFVSFVHDIQI